jgi:glutamate carboxypeptidase
MFTRLLAPLAAAFVLFLPAVSAEAQLTRAEQAMVHTIDAEQERTVAMLEKWVNQNSGTMNHPGVEAVGQMLRAELEPLGFAVEWIDMSAASRAGHIIARHKGPSTGSGVRGKRMLLIGHLDTVFEPDSPFQRWERQGDWAVGPGAVDDKGGMAVMIAALRAMHSAGTLRDADITVFLTGDEEDAGRPLDISRSGLIAAGKWADVALDFEGLARFEGRDMGSVARRSSGRWTVRATSDTGHSSTIFARDTGYGAIYELARILDAFRREIGEDKLTYNVGLIGGGERAEMDSDKIRMQVAGKTNIIPATAIARGDLRAIDDAQIERTRERMRAIAGRPLAGTKSEISFEDGYPPMAPTDANRALLRRLNQVNRDMGLEEMGELDPLLRGAADISFVARNVDGLAGLGAAGRNTHAEGEAVDIPSIFRQAKRAAILMSRLARERR